MCVIVCFSGQFRDNFVSKILPQFVAKLEPNSDVKHQNIKNNKYEDFLVEIGIIIYQTFSTK
jgi:hypothetical protein